MDCMPRPASCIRGAGIGILGILEDAVDNVKERRKALGWDRATLAQRTGLNKAVVALIERGQWQEDDALTRVAYVLNQAEAGNLEIQLPPPSAPEDR